jgi:hypothetical protein
MPSLDDIVPLPPKWRPQRDALRVVGWELVHYNGPAAQREAARFRHPIADYDFGLHRVRGIYESKVHVDYQSARNSSAADLQSLIDYYLESDRTPTTSSAIKGFFRRPENLVLSVLVAPYMATFLGLGLLGLRGERRHRRDVQARLAQLDETPVRWR